MKGGLLMSQNSSTEPKAAPVLLQMGIFAAILFVSGLISPLFPANFPVPTPVIGLILLYGLLAFKIIKLEWVEKFADFMIGLIAFLFVPSGIALTASLDVMKDQGIQLIIVIILSTIILLVVVSFVTAGMMWVVKNVFHQNTDISE